MQRKPLNHTKENDMTDQQKDQRPAQETSSDAPWEGQIDSGAALFALGQIAGTPGALAQLASIDMHPMQLVARHVAGDWGNIHPDDAESNREAVTAGLRIVSSYDLDCGTVLVVTEANRSATTVALPPEI